MLNLTEMIEDQDNWSFAVQRKTHPTQQKHSKTTQYTRMCGDLHQFSSPNYDTLSCCNYMRSEFVHITSLSFYLSPFLCPTTAGNLLPFLIIISIHTISTTHFLTVPSATTLYLPLYIILNISFSCQYFQCPFISTIMLHSILHSS